MNMIGSTLKSLFAAGVIGCLLVVACETKSKMDSNELAEVQNDAKFDGKAEKDAEFITDIAKINLSEIKISELAPERAKSTAVKEFASMMMEQHKKMYDEVAAFAGKKNISIADTVSKTEISGYENLKKENGIEFDKKYINDMVDGHKKTIAKFEEVSASDKYSPDIITLASQALPSLRMHYDKAKTIQTKMENKM